MMERSFRNPSPEQPRKMIVVIATLYAVFGPTFLSKTMAEITCFYKNEMPEVTTICSTEAAGLVYKQTTYRTVYFIGGMSTNKPICQLWSTAGV